MKENIKILNEEKMVILSSHLLDKMLFLSKNFYLKPTGKMNKYDFYELLKDIIGRTDLQIKYLLNKNNEINYNVDFLEDLVKKYQC